MPIPVSKRKSMKNKKIISLTLLSALLISGCTNANGETTPIKDSTNTTIRDSTNTTINTESVESENYQYYPLPDGTLSIAVGNNRDLQYLTISKMHHGKMVTQIADNGFANCTALKQINLPDNINMIGEQAFLGCSSLNSIKIPDSTSVIGNYAFERCSSLTICCAAEAKPEGWSGSWNSSDRPVVWGCVGYGASDSFLYDISKINNDTYAVITGYRGADTDIRIPETINGVKVAAIGDWAFRDCTSLTSITIPDSVTSIGDGAFGGCSSLTSVVIPGSVTSIGDSAFFGCKSLTSVSIGNGVTSIGSWAFLGCSSLTSVVIPGSVTSIGDYAFLDCSSLTICCEAEKQPEGWDYYWNYSNRPVVWGYKSKP